MSVLDDIVAGVRDDLAARQASVSESQLDEQVAQLPARAIRCRPSARRVCP